MHLPGAYRSLPRPSSALKPSHPSHSVVTSKYITVPTAGVGAYTWPHYRTQMSNLRDDLALHPRHFSRELHILILSFGSSGNIPRTIPFFVLGGDPAAGSPTATLLRLNPPYEA